MDWRTAERKMPLEAPRDSGSSSCSMVWCGARTNNRIRWRHPGDHAAGAAVTLCGLDGLHAVPNTNDIVVVENRSCPAGAGASCVTLDLD
jgi:hypothetical protein